MKSLTQQFIISVAVFCWVAGGLGLCMHHLRVSQQLKGNLYEGFNVPSLQFPPLADFSFHLSSAILAPLCSDQLCPLQMKNTTFCLNSGSWHHMFCECSQGRSQANVKLTLCFTSLRNHWLSSLICIANSSTTSNIHFIYFPSFHTCFQRQVQSNRS